MNKEQNEIEKMAKKLSDIMDGGMLEVDIDDIATDLYNAGYCKVAKPVIKDGEVIGFINNGDYEYVPKPLLTFAKGQARRETAREILQKLFTEYNKSLPIDDGTYGCMDDAIKLSIAIERLSTLAKEYGVELEKE